MAFHLKSGTWNFSAIVLSGVEETASAGLPSHLWTSIRLACFSGLGSRKTDLAASLSLRRGAVRGAGGVLEVCVPSSLAVAASGCR
jgi:hypothetical protein